MPSRVGYNLTSKVEDDFPFLHLRQLSTKVPWIIYME